MERNIETIYHDLELLSNSRFKFVKCYANDEFLQYNDDNQTSQNLYTASDFISLNKKSKSDIQGLLCIAYGNDILKNKFQHMFAHTSAHLNRLPQWSTCKFMFMESTSKSINWHTLFETKFENKNLNQEDYQDPNTIISADTIFASNDRKNSFEKSINQINQIYQDQNNFQDILNDCNYDDFWLGVAYIILISTSNLKQCYQPVFYIDDYSWAESILQLCPHINTYDPNQNIYDGINKSNWPCQLICISNSNSHFKTLLFAEPISCAIKWKCSQTFESWNKPLLVVKSDGGLIVNDTDRPIIELHHPPSTNVPCKDMMLNKITNTLLRYKHFNSPSLISGLPQFLCSFKDYIYSILIEMFPIVLIGLIYDYSFNLSMIK